MKKKIGISFTKTNFQYYWNWFTKDDLKNDFELVELSFEKNNIEDISKCDGFILTGGVDVDTSFYNGASSYEDKPIFQTNRDEFEKKIYLYSQEHNLPLLGICRGLQLVNVLQGGKLVEDMGDKNTTHKKDAGVDKQHEIKVEKNSLLNEITRSETSTVNSAHHQAVKTGALGENLVANAYSEKDEIIEGLEFKDKTGKAFMLCVQWHPERMTDKEKNPFSQKLKERFLDEVKNNKK
ncbi:MAG: gamma-glutamyl-gamma-aminobutyrate hydrolase family protein [Chitinophagaceae bacterium]